MPHHKSTIKRLKTNLKRQKYNTHYKSTVKTTIKKVLNSKEKEAGFEELKKAYSLLDKVARKNIIHKNRAANLKARLAKYVNSL